MPADPTSPVFDRLFNEAVAALLTGEHRQDEPPVDGGRWPVSIVAVPGPEVRAVLSDLMDEALVHAGQGSPLAWFEDQWQQRDIWYSSILHFAAPVLDPVGLVGWTRANRASLAHEVVIDALTLTRFRHRATDGGHHMSMEPWHSVELARP